MDNDKQLPLPCAIILEEQTDLTLREVSQACAVRFAAAGYQHAFVDQFEDGFDAHRWRFTGTHLRRATVAIRLQRDLGVNLAGAALALELLDEVAMLRARLRKMGIN